MNKTVLIGLMVVVLGSNGCGTFVSRSDYDPYEWNKYVDPSEEPYDSSTRVYSGFLFHFSAYEYNIYPWVFPPEDAPVGSLIFIDWFVLSPVADTLILPLTLYENCCTGALSEAAAHGDLDLVQQLLEAGTNVDEQDAWGHTPLMSASWGGHTDIVRVLLEGGADVKAATPRGWTAMRFATDQDHSEVVALLKAAGAGG